MTKPESKQKRSGYSLLEVLIVLALLGILSAIAIPQYSEHKKKPYYAEIDADARNIYTAAQAYLNSNVTEAVNSLDKLKAGGYVPSANIFYDNGSMTLEAGNIEVYSTKLKLMGIDNNSVIMHNGRIERPDR